MNFTIIGTNYKYTPIEIREVLSFPKVRIRDTLLNMPFPSVVLSTCNRIEVYALTSDLQRACAALEDFFIPLSDAVLYKYEGEEAVRHLLEVSCGIDSQIIGEQQILEQLGFAYNESKNVFGVNTALEKLFTEALRIGRKVRITTDIAAGDVSLGEFVLSFIQKQKGDLEGKNVLVIGAGKISYLFALVAKGRGLNAVFVANKNFSRAEKLAYLSGGSVVKFTQLQEKISWADVIISATSSPHLILNKEDILKAIDNRPLTIDHRPLLIIDLSVPRDVEASVNDIPEVELYCLDDLSGFMLSNLEERVRAVPEARKIINKEAGKLWRYLSRLELEAALARLP